MGKIFKLHIEKKERPAAASFPVSSRLIVPAEIIALESAMIDIAIKRHRQSGINGFYIDPNCE